MNQTTTETRFPPNLKLFRAVGAALAVFALAGILAPTLQAEVRLPKVFGSHMVLQQGKPLTIWGWAQPGETVTVQFLNESSVIRAPISISNVWSRR